MTIASQLCEMHMLEYVAAWLESDTISPHVSTESHICTSDLWWKTTMDTFKKWECYFVSVCWQENGMKAELFHEADAYTN
jgi:hypothetical protein